IVANPNKIRSIEEMRPQSQLKDVQHLTDCMAALGHFISRLGEKDLRLFKLLKKADRFEWNPEAERALQGLKEYLSSPLVLTAPLPEEPLLLYVAATPMVVSVVLMTKLDHADNKAAGSDLSAKEVGPKLARWPGSTSPLRRSA